MKHPSIALAMQPSRTEHVLNVEALRRLAAIGHLLDPQPLQSFSDDRARRVLAETDILISGWGAPYIGREVLAAAPRLRLIAHAAGTVKGIVDEQIFDAGIAVTHAAEANSVPVAEFTLAAIIFAGKQVFRFRDLYVADRDRDRTHAMQRLAIGNYRRTVGIVGASRIGRRVIELLRPFDMKVLMYDPYMTPLQVRELGAHKVGLSELLSNSDVASMHAPLLPETRHMLGAREFALMRNGATFINTARGAVIDQQALEAELISGRLNAVLDTTEPEVLPDESPLYRLPNVLLTPHIAGSLGTETQRLADYVVDEVERFARGQALKHRVRYDELVRLA